MRYGLLSVNVGRFLVSLSSFSLGTQGELETRVSGEAGA